MSWCRKIKIVFIFFEALTNVEFDVLLKYLENVRATNLCTAPVFIKRQNLNIFYLRYLQKSLQKSDVK